MGRRTVIVRVDRPTYDAVHRAVPKDSLADDCTVSGWLRLIVETLVAGPETNLRRRALMRLEGSYGRIPCRRSCRVSCPSGSRPSIGRRWPRWRKYRYGLERAAVQPAEGAAWYVSVGLLPADGAHRVRIKREWYGCYEKDQDARTEPRIKVYGPPSLP